MKIRKLLTLFVFNLWIFSSFAAGPSRIISLSDDFGSTNPKSVREVIGMDVAFAGKLASSGHGNLMFLLESPVVWTYVDGEGVSQSVQASVFECDPENGAFIDAFQLQPVEVEDGEDASVSLSLSDLEYNVSQDLYFGLDAEKSLMYVFEYGPDQEVAVTVEKTRMVEVVIPPESLLSEVVEVGNDVESMDDTTAPVAEEQSEPESIEEVGEQVTETVSENEIEAPETESIQEVVDEGVEPEEFETIQLEESEVAGAALSEELAEETEAMSESERVANETESANEVTPDGIEADEMEMTQAVESADNEVNEEEQAATTEIVATVPEAEKTIDLVPVEVPEILEEIEEEIVTRTKWVEESYEETITVMESHKFGHALKAYDLSDLEMKSIADLYFDKTLGSMMVLGLDDDENWVLKNIRIEGDRILSNTDEMITFNVEADVKTLFVDPLTDHWILITDEGVEMHSKEGRFLRKIADSVSFTDVVEVAALSEDEAESSTLYLSTASSFSPLRWNREGEDNVHHVPGEFASIQFAVDAAQEGDWVLLSPGSYSENVVVDGKSIQLASYYQLTQELYFLEHTVVQPASGIGLRIAGSENSKAYVSGLRFSSAETGIQSGGSLTIEHSELIENQTGLSLNGGTAMIADCEFAHNEENGVAFNDATASLLERSNIHNNGANGIVIDITPYDGVLYRTVIRRNTIRSNAEAGVRFDDQPITTQREFRIENNFILENGTAGVEVYLDQPDPDNLLPTGPRTKNSVYLVNNTIVGNPVGVLRGGNYRMINNIVAGSTSAGIQDLLYHSVIIRNLFWENGENAVESNFNASNNREEDPLFVGDDYILSVRSPAKRAGIPGNLWNDNSDRSGADIGASR